MLPFYYDVRRDTSATNFLNLIIYFRERFLMKLNLSSISWWWGLVFLDVIFGRCCLFLFFLGILPKGSFVNGARSKHKLPMEACCGMSFLLYFIHHLDTWNLKSRWISSCKIFKFYTYILANWSAPCLLYFNENQ